jgi:hypothetical protein
MNLFAFLVICVAGWMNRNQQDAIEYLQEEIRELKELMGKKPRFNDGQRQRLAIKGKRLGRKALDRFSSLQLNTDPFPSFKQLALTPSF